tara:strand:- start:36055 stop:36954 length:900 start_codon:yes stop_codon:yes gene_type:complete
MKIISFDVGIKNMAYCIFEFSNNNLTIQDWNIINLLENQKTQELCCFEIKSKKEIKICGKKAKYKKDEQCFCETHAKMAIKQNNWFFQNNLFKQSKLSKLSKEEIFNLGQPFGIFSEIPDTKKVCIQKILEACEKRSLAKIIKKKVKTANDTDLITVGKLLKIALNNIDGINDITHVVIENQISKIASRMKTVQGMLSQYFIMQDKCPHIEYVSSINKLKDLVTNNEKENTYKQHKKDSVEICKQILGQNPFLGNFDDKMKITKKDDLADAFLQGIWYLKRENIIIYADNLKINCVTLT